MLEKGLTNFTVTGELLLFKCESKHKIFDKYD